MSDCPKCGLEGLQWEKTKTGKNWLKLGKEWHSCNDRIIRYACTCGNKIYQMASKSTKRGICSVCQDKRFRV